MSEDYLFIKLRMWVVDGGDGQTKSVRYSYELPEAENDVIVELYKIFFETLCSEIAQLKGAEKILGLLSVSEEEEEEDWDLKEE